MPGYLAAISKQNAKAKNDHERGSTPHNLHSGSSKVTPCLSQSVNCVEYCRAHGRALIGLGFCLDIAAKLHPGLRSRALHPKNQGTFNTKTPNASSVTLSLDYSLSHYPWAIR